MCGIFGYVSWDRDMPPAPVLCRATNLLRHRGPDGGAYWQEPGVFFGHRRLAIIDLATGTQPMASADGRHVVIFNGEIYNYRELREELRREGCAFRTASDTEVILAGYALWGTDVVARLEGMFAFGLYDRHERTLLLARDRFGEKPLLVAQHDGRVAFASEMAPLAALGLCRRGIDSEALAGYLTLNYVPGDRTMADGVRRIGAGEWRLYDGHGMRRHARYWSPTHITRTAETAREDELLDELQRRLDDAVRLALRSDVPVGVFLSGGVDSSLIAESAARLGRLEAAFCVDFADEGFSEWPRATHVARKLGIELERVRLDSSVLGEFPDVTGHLDDPLADSSAMAVWTVARAAAKRVKVVLSGDGGDELFGGYLTYPASQWHARLRPWLPRAAWSFAAAMAEHSPVDQRVKVGRGYKLQRFLRAMPLPTAEAHFTWNGTWLPRQAERLLADGPAREAVRDTIARIAIGHGLGDHPSLHQLQLADVNEYLPNDILSKVDRATMAHGLESRAPFLNSGVASMALALPDRFRVNTSAHTKILLRDLCRRHFGANHANAPKQGFSLPIHSWLRHEGRTLVTTWLTRDRIDQLGVLDAGAVAQVVQSHLSGRAALGWELWGLMVLVAWYEQRVARPPDLQREPEPSDVPPVFALSPVGTR